MGPGSRSLPDGHFALPRGIAAIAPVGRLPLRLFSGEAALAARRHSAEGGKPPPLGATQSNPRRVTPPEGREPPPMAADARNQTPRSYRILERDSFIFYGAIIKREAPLNSLVIGRSSGGAP